jgi:hypothetical protein
MKDVTLDPKSIFDGVSGIAKAFAWVFDRWRKPKRQGGVGIPHESLRIALKPEGNCWWHMGKKGDDPIMQIVGRMFATNITSVPVRIPQIELRYGFLGRHCLSGMVSVSRGLHDNMHGRHDIPPGETRNVSCDFWLEPPVVKASEPFTAHSVLFIDQFGNRHVVKRVRFRSTAADIRPLPKEPEEFPYELSDPVEKEVVSVLKAELSRYQMCGRRVGGLGSVHIVYQSRPMTGVGSDSWRADSPVNQLIVPDPEAAELKSDNLDALMGFYKNLGSVEDRARFKAALLKRLDEKKGYLGISYFIVCALWRTGSLADALQKARRDLPVGESRVFGLSNILMLLNGLLKYRYLDFTNQVLDEIERMIHGLDEHPFLIPAKLAAIRTSRLSGKKSDVVSGTRP